MIGIVITAQGKDEDFPNKIYYKFGENCALERVVGSALKVDYAHKVIVEMPVEDKASITGNIHRKAVINAGLTETGRQARYLFSDGEIYQRIAHAGREMGLSTIVHIEAACLFMPTWLINEVIYFYMSNNLKTILKTYCPGQEDSYDKGFSISIYPYHEAVRASIYDENEIKDKITYFKNKNPNEIIKKDFSLYLESREQITLFDQIAEELKYGSIESILETMDV